MTLGNLIFKKDQLVCRLSWFGGITIFFAPKKIHRNESCNLGGCKTWGEWVDQSRYFRVFNNKEEAVRDIGIFHSKQKDKSSRFFLFNVFKA